ncbi:hypothetical protein GJ496_003984 [Pomphorhynchus laevis]|nr:hypothetical protein GJ496_003984 [Pomphorhynchus laevis]
MTLFPKRLQSQYIRCSQTGFNLDSSANMEFLCVRAALIAVMRSMNQGAAVGVMIASSNGPWYKNGITLVDFDGGFFPADWISLTEILLNCGNVPPLEISQLLAQKIPYFIMTEINSCFPKTFQNNSNENMYVPPSCGVSNQYNCRNTIPANVQRRQNEEVLIGFDTRPTNNIYVSLIISVCRCFGIKFKNLAYTTLPMLSWCVRTINTKGIKSSNFMYISKYLCTVANAFDEMLELLIKCDKAAVTKSSKRPACHLRLSKDCFPVFNDLYMDLANGVIAPFVIKFFRVFRSYNCFNWCKLFNIKSWILDCEYHYRDPPVYKRISSEGVNFTLTYSSPNNSEVNKAVANLKKNCGVDFVLSQRTFPFKFIANEKLSHCCSFDGDGDRLVFYFKNEMLSEMQILNGGHITILLVIFFKSIINYIGCIKCTIMVALNTYSNSAIKRYIEGVLGVHVVDTSDSISEMRKNVGKADIGIYFSVNGHGSVLFGRTFIEKLLTLRHFLSELIEPTTNGPNKIIRYRVLQRYYSSFNTKQLIQHLDRCVLLLNMEKLINPAMSDALTNFLAIEFILSFENIILYDWHLFCKEIPFYQLSWSPEIPATELPFDSLIFESIQTKMQTNKYLFRENISIQGKVVALMLHTGTMPNPYFNEHTLSIKEREVLRNMDKYQNFESELDELNVSFNITDSLKLWSAKYSYIYPGRLISSIIVLLRALRNNNARLVICPEEHNSRVKIYAECIPLCHAKMIAFGVMLLFRVHFLQI